ncbi:Pullulanase 1 [Morus notabilis]|uniref:Pullulanase 1 n=1 Tax=Morus notabilis TaxID=981085 RepID=W9RKU1_9ROSA|nr:Pullulanase 1 [Morus notabilis]
MPLLRSSHLLHSHFPTAPTTNRYFPPPGPTTNRLSLPSPQRRRLFTSTAQNPFLSLPFHAKPLLRCFSASSMSASTASPSTSQDCSLLYSRAYWVSESIIAWNVDVGNGSCFLFASKTADLSLTENDGVQGQDLKVKLEEDGYNLPENVIAKFPHIHNYRAYRVPPHLDVKQLLKCQLAVAAFDSDGKCSNATGLQLPGVLDELFSYSGPLGAVYSSEAISLFLWAPTAQAVQALIYKDPSGESSLEILQLEETNGVWSKKGPKSWDGCYYIYEVSVYHPSALKIVKCYANDPYARGLSADGGRTLFVDIASDILKPEGWDKLAYEKPNLLSFSDISIYELHVRDFSATDLTVNDEFRGGYLAFTLQGQKRTRVLLRKSWLRLSGGGFAVPRRTAL